MPPKKRSAQDDGEDTAPKAKAKARNKAKAKAGAHAEEPAPPSFGHMQVALPPMIGITPSDEGLSIAYAANVNPKLEHLRLTIRWLHTNTQLK